MKMHPDAISLLTMVQVIMVQVMMDPVMKNPEMMDQEMITWMKALGMNQRMNVTPLMMMKNQTWASLPSTTSPRPLTT